jgi:alpha-beta hydrolase superfamily lysophospholipase
MRKITTLLIWAAAVYVLVGMGLFAFQKKIIFRPEPLSDDYKFQFNVPFEELRIPINDKEQLSAILFKANQPKGIVLYFHGNMKNISYYEQYVTNFTSQDYDVLMMDYRTYGKSTGKLSEDLIYADALHMYQIARKRFEPDQIIIYGRSLGTGVAAELASVRDCKALMLESPYYSVEDVAKHFIPFYPHGMMLEFKFPTYTYLPKVTAPVAIFHGTEDHTVPFSSGEKLKQFLKPGDEFIPVPGASHHNLNDYPLYHQRLDSMLKK